MPATIDAPVSAPAQAVPVRAASGPIRPRRIARSDRWTAWHVVAGVAMGALAIWATLDAWSDILLIARRNEEYSHIFLVPFVALAMIYVRRARFRYCKPTATGLGFVIAGLGWCMHVFGFYHNYVSLWHVGAVMVLVGCIVSVLSLIHI